MRIIFLSFVLILSACGGGDYNEKFSGETLPIDRHDVTHYDAVESELIEYNGVIYTIIFRRTGSSGEYVEIYDGVNKIHDFLWPYGLGSAIVINNNICLFGVTDWSKSNSVYKTCLDGNFNPISTDLMFSEWTYNTSVIYDGARYIMAHETNTNVPFSIGFKESTDLLTWTDIGDIFKPERYAAAPMIKYIDGEYIIFWLAHEGDYITRAAKTTDFVNFTDASIAVLAPTYEEGSNTSDLSIIEKNGKVLFSYADGDQQTYGNTRSATFNGDYIELKNRLFPVP